jgi:hypothetical protein
VSKGRFMTTGKSLATIYQILNKKLGPADARMTVTAILGNVIADLQDEGQPVTESAIDSRLAKAADDYIQVTKSDVA